MIAYIIIFTVVLLIVTTVLLLSKDDDLSRDGVFFACGVWPTWMLFILGIILFGPIPAIDVYRDKTTLQITYQDSVPVDSVVVYKNQ